MLFLVLSLSMELESTTRRDALIDELIELFLADGFSRFSVEQLASYLRCSKSTVYTIAPSKEQIVTAVVRAFFRRATERVEARMTNGGPPAQRISNYLEAISAELQPASAVFFADLDTFAPAMEIYRRNTEIAAGRVRELVTEGMGAFRLNAAFVGAVAGVTMEYIHRGHIGALTGLDDSAAYRALADLIVAGMTTPSA